MYSKMKIMGHPIHPMIVNFPIAFYTAAFACFLAFQFNEDPFWHKVGFISNIAGVVTALVAAAPGFLDWYLGIPKETNAKRRGLVHAALNVGALLFFSANLFLLWGTMETPTVNNIWPLGLTGIGLLFTAFAGWHGFALMSIHKVGIELSPEQEDLEMRREKREAA